MATRFADGVWLVELAAVREPAQVPSAVTAALGIPERPGVPAAGSLAAVLARQQLLLVLDNCEHVIEAVAGLCGTRLSAADDIRVLATSREPVGSAQRHRAPSSFVAVLAALIVGLLPSAWSSQAAWRAGRSPPSPWEPRCWLPPPPYSSTGPWPSARQPPQPASDTCSARRHEI
jgi:hypothetical protein